MQTNIKTKSGNRTLIMMNGVQYGLLQSFRGSDDYSPEPASGIGDIHAVEWVPSMARHQLSISKMVLDAEKMRADGIFPENGDAVLLGLVFDIVIVDKTSQQTLRTYTGCSYTSGDLEITKHQIVMTNGTLYALDVRGTGV